MIVGRFNEIVTEQLGHCVTVLDKKGREYAYSSDRLDHFKISAIEQDIRPEQALWGMAAKHITSLSSMCKSNAAGYTKEVWREKITDTMNYMILLWALVQETEEVDSDVNT